MSQDPESLAKKNGDPAKVLSENSYHSAILRDPWNQRWGTSMDVAIGQEKTLDNKDWQALWVAIADWKTPLSTIKNLPKFKEMKEGSELVVAACTYYSSGVLPDSVTTASLPTLLVSDTTDQRSNPEKPVTPPMNWNFNGLPR